MKHCVFGIGLMMASAAVNLALASPARQSVPLNGTWRFEYSCAHATGLYAERCASGERDDFTLSLAASDEKICGWYELTAQLGNHVDDGDLNDWKFTPTTDRAWQVHFHTSGTVGEAVVRIKGKKLLWKLLTQEDHDEGQPLNWSFSPPDNAVLTRQKPGQPRDARSCGP